MNLISEHNGAVFFIDILGISALTNNKLPLTNLDYSAWLDAYSLEYSNQYLAATILAEFRQLLMDLEKDFRNITIAQFSDCAFIWSENIKDIILFTTKFMISAINKGLLCRGGLSYGEIIVTNQKHHLGRFIVGKAVTEAAKLEGLAKGARVLINEDLPAKLWEEDKCFAESTLPLFCPFTNPLDFAIYDEFKWYLCPYQSVNSNNLNTLTTTERIEYTKLRLKIANRVRCSPKFYWNSKSKEGQVQLNATINFISQNNLLDVYHEFAWKGLVEKRTEKIVDDIDILIDVSEKYFVA
jgi:hypothetical protein